MSCTNRYSRTIGDFLFIGALGLLLFLLRRIVRKAPSGSDPAITPVSSTSASLQQHANSVHSVTDEIALDSNNKIPFNIVDTMSEVPSEEVSTLQEATAPDPAENAMQESKPEESQKLEGVTERTVAYCVKCHEKREMQSEQRIVTKNGRNALEGTCPVCGTKLFRFIAR